MVNSSNLLKGKIAIVTGGRRGIGRAIALTFAEAGADVSVADVVIQDGKLDEVAREITHFGRRSLAVGANITKRSEVEELVKQVTLKFGRVDILVNCAGIFMPGKTIVEDDERNWDNVIAINLKGTYLCCRTVAKKMMEQNSGNIINLASTLGINPIPCIGAYGASKAAIILFSQQFAIELGPYNIRVNAIAPGLVKTDMNTSLRSSPEVEKEMGNKMVLGRLGETDDIAKVALFLASENSAYISGQTISVHGGGQIPTFP